MFSNSVLFKDNDKTRIAQRSVEVHSFHWCMLDLAEAVLWLWNYISKFTQEGTWIYDISVSIEIFKTYAQIDSPGFFFCTLLAHSSTKISPFGKFVNLTLGFKKKVVRPFREMTVWNALFQVLFLLEKRDKNLSGTVMI